MHELTELVSDKRPLQAHTPSKRRDSDTWLRADDDPSGANLNVPTFLRQLVAHLRAHCVRERGLFRIAAQASRVRALMQTIDEDFYRADSHFCLADCLKNKPHDAADLLKKFLKKLHAPLLTRELIAAFRVVGRIRDVRTQVEALNMLTLLLPEPNRNALLLVLSLLDDVARNCEANKMTLHNVATVFAPTLLYDHRDPNARNAVNPQASVSQNIAASAIALGATPAFLACSRSVSSNSLASIAAAQPKIRPGNPSELNDAPHKPSGLHMPNEHLSIANRSLNNRLGRTPAKSTQNLPSSVSHSQLAQPVATVSRSSSAIINAPGADSQLSLTNSDISVVKILIHYHRLLAIVPTKFTMQLRAYLRMHYLVSDMPPPPKVPQAKRLSCTIAQRLNAALNHLQPESAIPSSSLAQPIPPTTEVAAQCPATPVGSTELDPVPSCRNSCSVYCLNSRRKCRSNSKCTCHAQRTPVHGCTQHGDLCAQKHDAVNTHSRKPKPNKSRGFWLFRASRSNPPNATYDAQPHCHQHLHTLQFTARRTAAESHLAHQHHTECHAPERLVASLELERRRNGEVYPLVIRVHAPSFSVSRKMIDVSMKPKVRQIVERFFRSTTPRSRLHYLAFPPAPSNDAETNGVPVLNTFGTCLPEDVTPNGQHVTYLYEVGAGIGEMRLDPDANMWDVYLRNPLAQWIIK